MLQTFLQIVDTPEEQSKFEKLYYQYMQLMHFIAKNILNDEGLTEDAVNEAFLRIAKNFHKVGDIDSGQTKSFILIIVRNVSLDMLKNNGTDLGYESDAGEAAEENAGHTGPVGDNVFESIRYNALVAEIKSLPAIYRDVMYLLCVCEYRYVEIATMLDLSVVAVQKRAQRGREVLIERLGGRYE